MNRSRQFTKHTNVAISDLPAFAGLQGIYVLHFIDPVTGNTMRYVHAMHYTGYAKDLQRRLLEHLSGHGSNLTTVIKNAGLSFKIAAIYVAPVGMTESEARQFERSLKTSGSASGYCPICKVEHRELATA